MHRNSFVNNLCPGQRSKRQNDESSGTADNQGKHHRRRSKKVVKTTVCGSYYANIHKIALLRGQWGTYGRRAFSEDPLSPTNVGRFFWDGLNAFGCTSVSAPASSERLFAPAICPMADRVYGRRWGSIATKKPLSGFLLRLLHAKIRANGLPKMPVVSSSLVPKGLFSGST